MRLQQYLTELSMEKDKWYSLTKDGAKIDMSDTIIKLVKIAYKNTPEGSFVNILRDIKNSFYWIGIDNDEDTDLDGVIFGRKPRASESWKGIKLQGIGHDNTSKSKSQVINKVVRLLSSHTKYWIEASDALEHILYKHNVPYVTDVEVLNKLYGEVEMIGNKGQYTRKLSDGKTVTETTFGHVEVK